LNNVLELTTVHVNRSSGPGLRTTVGSIEYAVAVAVAIKAAAVGIYAIPVAVQRTALRIDRHASRCIRAYVDTIEDAVAVGIPINVSKLATTRRHLCARWCVWTLVPHVEYAVAVRIDIILWQGSGGRLRTKAVLHTKGRDVIDKVIVFFVREAGTKLRPQ
jgi:hypothetical protein